MAFGGNQFESNPPVEVVEEAEKRATADAVLQGEINAVTKQTSGIWTPGQLGYEGWTFDPIIMFEGQDLDPGIVDTSYVSVPSTTTLKFVHVYFEKVGKGLTAGQNLIAVYDSESGNRLALSGDLTAEWENATNEGKTIAFDFGAGFTVPSGIAYVAKLSNGEAGPKCGSYTEGKATTYKDPRYYHSPGGITAFPAHFGELGAQTLSGDSHWVALS